MSVTDFLFNGSPPASTTTYGSTTSSLPAWYNDYTQGLISKANAIAATPYQAYTGARVAGFTDPQSQAFQNVANQTQDYQSSYDPQGNIIGGAFAPAGTDLQQASQNAQAGFFSDSPIGQDTQSAVDNATSQNIADQYSAANTGLSAAQGVSQGLAQPNNQAISNIGAYFSPYTNNVVNSAAQQGALANQSALQQVSDQFAGSGQYGGSRMGQALGNAANLAAQNTQNTQASLLNTGYNNALAGAQQGFNQQLQAAGQAGSQATAQGALAGQQQQGYGQLASQLSGLQSQQLQNQIAAGNAQSQLASQAAQTGTSQNAALEAVGSEQQQLNQQNLDTAYQDFQNQVNYPMQQASFLNDMIRGLQVPTTQTSTQTGPASVYQASPLAQIAAAGTGLAGLSKVLGS